MAIEGTKVFGYVKSRPLAGFDDVMAVRAFLSATYLKIGTGLNWEIRRWEGQFWHDDSGRLEHTSPERFAKVQIWESRPGHIVGVVTPEDGGDAHLQIDSDYRDLEPDMLAWAEQHLARSDDGFRTLVTFCLDGDRVRARVLRQRGYILAPTRSVQRWRDLAVLPTAVGTAQSATIRGLQRADRADIERLTGLINAAFGHSFATSAVANFTTSPSYATELQIVAELDGELISHVGITIDDATKLAIVEPVCTRPDAIGQGLATTVLAEGLRRAAERGAARAVVSTGVANPSNHVYAKLGFDHVEVVRTWNKTWTDTDNTTE